MIKLTISDGANVSDVTGLCESITWSGDYQQCVRTLEFALIQSSTDGNVPVVKCELGNLVTFSMDGRVLFLGYIFSREKSTEDSKISIKCYDRGIYLKKNKGMYKFSGQTAEGIAKRVCADFGVGVGQLAATGIAVSRIFNGVPLYNIIQTAYTLASQKNGKKYIARFVGDKFCVLEKKVNDETLILEGGVNLMSANISGIPGQSREPGGNLRQLKQPGKNNQKRQIHRAVRHDTGTGAAVLRQGCIGGG